jgi:hypothetical protein
LTRISPPLLGYNNNVRYLGRTFHIQTEDSGTKYARIMTHLFIDGGRIVKTTRTEYGAMVDQPDMAETVRRMMKDQHKNMFLSLRAGEFDQLIDRVLHAESPTVAVDPALSRIPRLRADSLPSLSFGSGDEAKTMPGMAPLVVESTPVPAATHEMPVARVLAEPVAPAELRDAMGSDMDAAPGDSGPASTQLTALVPQRPSGRPRKNKSLAPAAPRRSRLVDDPTPTDLPETALASESDRPSGRISERQVVARPPTLTHEAIDPRGKSIFGDAAAGRQTLDEVILSFLEDEET